MPFVKLDTAIRTSSLWVDRDLRSVFLTALVMAEVYENTEPTPTIQIRSLEPGDCTVPPGWYGYVRAAGIGIIREDQCEVDTGYVCLERLAAPDPESRTEDHEGRRMVRINGGFLILNYFKFRDQDFTAADRMRKLRARKKAMEAARKAAIEAGVTPNDDDVTPNGDGVTRNVCMRNVTRNIAIFRNATVCGMDILQNGDIVKDIGPDSAVSTKE